MRIAIVRLSAMGDIIQSMIVLQFIKEHSPDSSIDWFVDRKFSDILEGAKHVDNIFPLQLKGLRLREVPFKLIKLYKFIKSKGKYDLVIDLQGLIKSGLVTKFISTNKRIGFNSRSSRESLSAIFYSQSYDVPYEENVIQRYVSLIEQCFEIKVPTNKIIDKESFFFSEKQNNPSQNNYAVFFIGASFQSKIYPIEKFADVSNSLSIDIVIVWNSRKEKILAERLKKLSPKVNVSRKLNFEELKDLVSRATVVLGGDTGPTHLAWGMNVPSVTLFGATPMNRNFFPTKINLAVDSGVVVNPNKINKTHSSIRNIPSQDIVNLLNKIITQ